MSLHNKDVDRGRERERKEREERDERDREIVIYLFNKLGSMDGESL